MAIAYVNGATGTTSLTFTSPVAGYLQVIFAFRDGSNTAPTVPTPPTGNAWTVVPSPASGANTCSSVMCYRIVASSSDTGSGTFTNATSVVAAQYSGCHQTTPVGTNDSNTGASSNTVSFNAVTFVGGSTSWAVGAVGSRQTDGTITNVPTGMTNRQSTTDATDEAALHDTNGGVSGWSTTTVSIGGTSTGYRARVIEIRASGANTTLTPTVGSYTLTGTALTKLSIGHTIVPAVGSYSLTGTALTKLGIGRNVVPASGSYTLSGTALTKLGIGRNIVPASGSYSLSGQNVTLTKNVTTVPASGSYALSGTSINLKIGRNIVPASGSYTLTGQSIILTKGVITAITPGNYTLSGQNVTLTKNITLIPAVGSYVLTGTALNALQRAIKIIPAVGSYLLTGVDPSLYKGKIISVTPGSYSLTGNSINLRLTLTLHPAVGSYIITGVDPTLAIVEAFHSPAPEAGPFYIPDVIPPQFIIPSVSAPIYSIPDPGVQFHIPEVESPVYAIPGVTRIKMTLPADEEEQFEF